jgi:hypothetical protein
LASSARLVQLSDQLLKHRLYLRLRDGSVIHPSFVELHGYYRPTRALVPSQRSLVDWGGASRRPMNPWSWPGPPWCCTPPARRSIAPDLALPPQARRAPALASRS